jgi:hypothetical protein
VGDIRIVFGLCQVLKNETPFHDFRSDCGGLICGEALDRCQSSVFVAAAREIQDGGRVNATSSSKSATPPLTVDAARRNPWRQYLFSSGESEQG